MIFNKCSNCGANLDPGEKCDCEKGEEKETRMQEFIDNYLNRDNPYDVDERPVGICTICGCYLFRGDVAYDIEGETWCESCVDDAKYFVEE